MKMIYFHIHNDTQVQTLTGKYPFRSGRQFFLAEPLRKVAGDYSVSYEAVRRVLRAERKKTG